jgi:aryl-alcohol dehydrogenase-like predicted oxidoreductase
VLAACDRSLKALGTDTIDLYQLHAPSADVPIEETMSAMADLVAAGKVRHVGVSNFSVREMQAAEAALGLLLEINRSGARDAGLRVTGIRPERA